MEALVDDNLVSIAAFLTAKELRQFTNLCRRHRRVLGPYSIIWRQRWFTYSDVEPGWQLYSPGWHKVFPVHNKNAVTSDVYSSRYVAIKYWRAVHAIEYELQISTTTAQMIRLVTKYSLNLHLRHLLQAADYETYAAIITALIGDAYTQLAHLELTMQVKPAYFAWCQQHTQINMCNAALTSMVFEELGMIRGPAVNDYTIQPPYTAVPQNLQEAIDDRNVLMFMTYYMVIGTYNELVTCGTVEFNALSLPSVLLDIMQLDLDVLHVELTKHETLIISMFKTHLYGMSTLTVIEYLIKFSTDVVTIDEYSDELQSVAHLLWSSVLRRRDVDDAERGLQNIIPRNTYGEYMLRHIMV